MQIIKNLLIALFCLGSLSAQNFIGKINPYPEPASEQITTPPVLKILAVMVDFQEDKDQSTFGNGKFGSMYTKDYGNTILDPLPHDKNYFSAHLTFVKNYFTKASNGNMDVQFHILPDVITVSKTMRNYSPDGDNFTPLADFTKEVWIMADQSFPGFTFSDYDFFIVFHAGVGRDISLPGSIGNEKDLPSVYLGERAYKKIYGDSFTGIPVSGGGFNIFNTAIIPSTESREIEGFGGKILFQMSINGLLAATTASHLGLPDLFNTETGLSAIGRFGLMDGQAIFAYSGLFPPDLSAWEKIYLGWADYTEIEPAPGQYMIDLPTKLAAGVNEKSIVKVPMSSTEYYLVENRNRDANNNGAIVKYVLGGDTLTKAFYKDTTGFYSFRVDSLAGVVIDVDEFDWAVPGSGIVIWHIDENVIREKLPDNKINVDKLNRGVSVVEADGIPDIGERFNTIFGDVVIGEGFEEDLWFASNPSDLYKNRFSSDTKPATLTNSGAYTHITIRDFSDIANRMTFFVSFEDSLIKPVISSKLNLPSNKNKITSIETSAGVFFYILSDSTLYRVDATGNITHTVPSFSNFKPAAVYFNGMEHIVGAINTHLNVFLFDGNVSTLNGKDIGERITAPPVIRVTVTEQYDIFVGTDKGKIQTYTLDIVPGTTIYSSDNKHVEKIAVDGFEFSSLLKDANPVNSFYYAADNKNNILQLDYKAVDFAMTKNRNGELILIVLSEVSNNDYEFIIIGDGKILNKFQIKSLDKITSFSLTDLKQDGENYILFNNGNQLEAVNLQGSSAVSFPFKEINSKNFTGTPMTANFTGDNHPEIVVSTVDGRIFAVDGKSGKVVRGYPISSGAKTTGEPFFIHYNNRLSYVLLNEENYLYGWSLSLAQGDILWSGENGNRLNSSFIAGASSPNYVNEFFPKEKAYNYPNPVYDGETKIRYYVSEDSKISIKIFDLAGDFVAELNDYAAAGFDNETSWNVGNIQSGVYLARIEAASSSGKTGHHIIKIAVIK